MNKLIAISGCFIIASFSSCTAYIVHNDNNAMLEMVKNGASPVDARCAVKGGSVTCLTSRK